MTAASLACGLRSVPANRRSGRRNGTRRAPLLSETLPYNQGTGGTVNVVTNYNGTGKTYRVHRFTVSGALLMSVGLRPCRVLVLGGGGNGAGTGGYGSDRSGQWYSHGAGGAGGMLEDNARVIAPGSHAVTVGGAAQNSVFGAMVANAGGSGGWIFGGAGAGGSGGGAGVGENGNVGSRAGGAGTAGQGFAGGSTVGQEGGGGGGAGGPGAEAAGGPGKASNITGTSVVYAAGGHPGGSGAGAANTGNGGGSIGRVVAPVGGIAGGPGGSGLVCVAYEVAA